MPFQKGHKHSPGVNGQLRKDLTTELVSQLNEVLKDANGVDRLKLHRVVKNLITQATTSADKMVDGKLIDGAGDCKRS